jgi:flagellar biosynthesis anti-sigma factor FlgM
VSVTLSSKARQLDQASTSDASEKIARLRAAVSSGQLKIDPDKIAAAIVGE